MLAPIALNLLPELLFVSSALAGVVPIPIWKKPVSARDSIHGDVLPRATVLEQLYNNRQRGSYYANITVGTPGQPVSVVLDTGSSDLWVLASVADICVDPSAQSDNPAAAQGCIGGTYDHTKSSTYSSLISNGFKIQYVDQSFSEGDYISDTISFGGSGKSSSTITKLQMGLAYNSTLAVGIMGIGYNTTEASKTPYPNIIDLMVEQGLINTRAYSLWLDDLASTTGQILFGGIDTAKFSGSLLTLPLQSSRGQTPDSFAVALTGISAGTPGKLSSITSTDFSIPVILDSGTTQTLLPTSIMESIIDGLGAYDATEQAGVILVDCGLRELNPDFVFSYQFGDASGPVINVPLSEVILDFSAADESALNGIFDQWESVCYLAFADSSTTGAAVYLLGDSFLRSAYVVYDIGNSEVAMAQSNFNSGTNKIMEIMSGSKIPSITGQPDTVSATPTATGLSGLGGLITARPSGDATATGESGADRTGSGGSAASSSNAAVATPQLPAMGGAVVVMALSLGFATLGGLLIIL